MGIISFNIEEYINEFKVNGETQEPEETEEDLDIPEDEEPGDEEEQETPETEEEPEEENFDIPEDEEPGDEEEQETPETEEEPEEDLDMPEDEGSEGEDTGDTSEDEEPEEDFDMPEDEEPSNNETNDSSESSDDEDNFDMPEDEGSEGEDTGDSNNNSLDSSSSMDDNTEDPAQKLKELENSIFDKLSPEEKDMKIKELKGLYISLYSKCDNIIKLVNDAPKYDVIIKIYEYINKSLIDLKTYIVDYIDGIFDSKTYMENLAMFQKYLTILDSIRSVFDEIRDKKLE